MKKLTILLIIPIFLYGCATVNFSSKYYTLPKNYSQDIDKIWEGIKKLPLKNNYSYKIVSDKEIKPAGIPQIKDCNIYLPDLFIKYIYQYYYNNRSEILTCIILHEIAHTEYGIPATPPETHYLCDNATIQNLLIPYFLDTLSINKFYSSLCIVSHYWQARKGIGGHALYWTYNLAVFWYGGIYVDWFATDIEYRLLALRTNYPNIKFIFKHSNFQRAN